MVSTLVIPRVLAARSAGRRAMAVTGRNVAAMRGPAWMVVASGAFEPLFYLFSLGVGVGALVGELPLPDGRLVGYAEYVAPAMLAASAMTAAISETTFNFFGKMQFMRLYDGMLATPVGPMEIALGELSWAMARGALYSASFLAVMVAMDLTSPARALLALPATVLTGFAFGALGMTIATFLNGWQDFDLIGTVQFALFFFSGTFIPADDYPTVLRWLVEASPLYRSVSLVRAITTGGVGWVQLIDVLYLLALFAVGIWAAGRRMDGRLRR